LIETVGDGGTVMVPTFTDSYPWLDREPFHPVRTPPYSTISIIADRLRLRENAVRSFHPSHSIAAIGGKSAVLTKDHYKTTPFGKNSPLGKFLKMDGKILLIGVKPGLWSIAHVIEDWINSPFMMNDVSAHFIDDNGNVTIVKIDKVPWSFKEIDNIYTNFPNKAMSRLTKAKLVREGRIGNAKIYCFKATDVYDMSMNILKGAPIDPCDVDFYQGCSLMVQKRYNEAMEIFQRVIERYPQNKCMKIIEQYKTSIRAAQ